MFKWSDKEGPPTEVCQGGKGLNKRNINHVKILGHNWKEREWGQVEHMGSRDQENFIFFKESKINAFSHVDDNFLLVIEAEAGYIQCVWACPCEIQSSG